MQYTVQNTLKEVLFDEKSELFNPAELDYETIYSLILTIDKW